jgi:hypothetical protein
MTLMKTRFAAFTLLALFSLGCSDGDSSDGEAADEAPDDGMGGAQMEGEPAEVEATTFEVTIENISGDAMPPSPIAPGVWVIHEEGEPIFTEGEADRGDGLERLAEDGAPDILSVRMADLYETGPFDPDKDSYATDAAMPGDQFVGDVDIFLWNAGTEVDQPLGEGADQPMRQADVNTGEDEDGVVELSDLDAADYVRVTIEAL